MSSGSASIDELSFQQALFWVQNHHESYNEIWGYQAEQRSPSLALDLFTTARSSTTAITLSIRIRARLRVLYTWPSSCPKRRCESILSCWDT